MAQDTLNTKTARKTIDWEAVERGYRAGMLSIRELAKLHDVSDKAIRNRAKAELWKRPDAYQGSSKVVLQEMDSIEGAGFIYVLMIDSGLDKFFKIGMSKHFGSRFATHQCASPFEIHVVCSYYIGNMRAEERALHERYAEKRVRGEWFRLTMDDLKEISQRSIMMP